MSHIMSPSSERNEEIMKWQGPEMAFQRSERDPLGTYNSGLTNAKKAVFGHPK